MWIIPLVGLPTTITGLVLGLQGLESKKRTRAAVGISLSILFLVITILNAAWGAISERPVNIRSFHIAELALREHEVARVAGVGLGGCFSRGKAGSTSNLPRNWQQTRKARRLLMLTPSSPEIW